MTKEIKKSRRWRSTPVILYSETSNWLNLTDMKEISFVHMRTVWCELRKLAVWQIWKFVYLCVVEQTSAKQDQSPFRLLLSTFATKNLLPVDRQSHKGYHPIIYGQNKVHRWGSYECLALSKCPENKAKQGPKARAIRQHIRATWYIILRYLEALNLRVSRNLRSSWSSYSSFNWQNISRFSYNCPGCSGSFAGL